jgi:protein-S-isoprenylcysteine O-methyltransferase Ste14
MGHREEGEVKDLVEKLRRGELTRDDVLEEMRKRGLFHHAYEPIPGMFSMIVVTVWGVLCFLPVICEVFNLGIPEIPSIQVPFEMACLSFLFSIIMAPPLFYSAYLREKRSITGDENIILVKEGAYGIVRHPAALGGLILLLLVPVMLTCSPFNVPFTVFSFLGDVMVFILFQLLAPRLEEKINIRKWGDEYRQYMKEVPRFNFILGAWRWSRRKRDSGVDQ